MIRLAKDADFPSSADNEVLVRICALRLTYGINAPFVHYYTDEAGSLMSIMDGVALFHTAHLNDEWCTFISMNPDILTIHCTKVIGEALIQSGVWHGQVGETMQYSGEFPDSAENSVCTNPPLPAVYSLLKDHFPGIAPFNSWYPDVSHRIRHKNSHIAAVMDTDTVVSTAMTVAETDDAAILGQVATHPDFRRRGLAQKCIKSTLYQCKGKTLYILPVDEIAQKLYKKLGFKVIGSWAELERTL